MIYKKLKRGAKSGKKMFALLIDPDKYIPDNQKLISVIKEAERAGVDFIFVGGSLIFESLDVLIKIIKSHSSLPVIIFPGSAIQISEQADAILFLSLISGRNPEFLIGNHVVAAPFLRKSSLEIIPTAYLLVQSDKTTSVEYMSNTKPIPADKPDIAVATAIAGEMLGLKLIYLEAGSGANQAIRYKIISDVKKATQAPLIVGGGIKTPDDVRAVAEAGADIVVVGTTIETKPELLKPMVNALKQKA